MSKRTLLSMVLYALLAAACIAFFATCASGGAANTVSGAAVFVLLVAWIFSAVKDNGFYNRGWQGYGLAVILAVFYYTLYKTDVFDDLIHLVWQGGNRWHFYGFLYTVAVLWMGASFIAKNRRSRYQVVRTSVVMIVQLGFAFCIPVIMSIFVGKDYYLSYLWPLKIDLFYPQDIQYMTRIMNDNGFYDLPKMLVAYGFLVSLVGAPLAAFFWGKRWYCSWVCGCGGLANTFGDPWRHLSSKTNRSWKIETITIHLTLLFALVTTVFVMARPLFDRMIPALSRFSQQIQEIYGLVVVTLLAGTLGVILYPVMGTRVWCRFFCPMAALLGLIQRTGRFRIAVNGQMCMACGNCSRYCEMGIDVRSYAMAGTPFRRASCVGCGLCQHVCPRGVLRLENEGEGILPQF